MIHLFPQIFSIMFLRYLIIYEFTPKCRYSGLIGNRLFILYCTWYFLLIDFSGGIFTKFFNLFWGESILPKINFCDKTWGWWTKDLLVEPRPNDQVDGDGYVLNIVCLQLYPKFNISFLFKFYMFNLIVFYQLIFF